MLYGGKSAEHEVSVRSARSILDSLDPERFEAIPVGIDRNGSWYLSPPTLPLQEQGEEVSLLPHRPELVSIEAGTNRPVDVVFPVLHGPLGEDGTVQGFLELANIPYVGAGVLASAIGMDKDVTKRLLSVAGLRVAPSRSYISKQVAIEAFEELVEDLGSRIYVKPANLGSSVGVSKVIDRDSYEAGVASAFGYDTKIIVESEIVGREIECSVLGNDHPIASVPGEIRPADGFYSYEAKYLDEGAELIIPADLTDIETEAIQRVAVDSFTAICCSGMARVDMFLRASGEVVVNEINTIPGFTNISMYPKLWEASGIGYEELVSRLIDLAIERHDRRSQLSTRYEPDRDTSA